MSDQPEMRRFCISTTEIREALRVKMRKELRQTTKALQEQVRFARARFGNYDVIDFVAVLIGYILSGEPTLQAFYERLAPFA